MFEEKDQLTLKKLRERAGLTQRQLADRFGITIKTISAWERGVTEPHLTFAETQRLMEVLQCRLEELVEATSKLPEK
jgi:transcriptional regulator with XRE-family HTH domain